MRSRLRARGAGASGRGLSLGDQIPAGVGSVQDFIENHRAGKLRVLAVMGDRRQAALPDVPTFAELGLKGFEDVPYYGFIAPAGTPKAAIDPFSAALAKVLAQPDVREMKRHMAGETAAGTRARKVTARTTSPMRGGRKQLAGN
ncbi:MAG: hypothetical protein BroJett031_03120 [Betaproteobacteria bacterium]|nr:MAG: hypothetical protein BroJett031_03120 [Betaproteobacteria bacterium]